MGKSHNNEAWWMKWKNISGLIIIANVNLTQRNYYTMNLWYWLWLLAKFSPSAQRKERCIEFKKWHTSENTKNI